MNIKKLWMPVFALLLSSTVISAQEQRIKEQGLSEEDSGFSFDFLV